MKLGFILGLIAITLVVVALVIYFGRKLSRHVQTHAPDSDLTVHVTPSGNVLFACLVGFWINSHGFGHANYSSNNQSVCIIPEIGTDLEF